MIELPPDVEDKLREKAARHGQTVGDYLRLI
jgi:plasmid stability protein